MAPQPIPSPMLRPLWFALAVAQAGLSACSGGNGGSAATGPRVEIVVQSGLPTTPGSLSAVRGGARTDPEGLAPDAPDTSVLTWRDARFAERALVLGAHLYEYRFSFTGGEPDPGAVTARSANDDAYGHPGFGYVVSHNSENGNSPLGKGNRASRITTTVFAGGHHARHRVEMVYDRDLESGGNGVRIPLTIEWLVATGWDHPIWAVNFRMAEATRPAGVDLDRYRMDVRGPYGSLNFDGAPARDLGDAIGGVSWGDHALRFDTLGAPLTLDSAWTYDTPNSVNFTRAWTESTNAEMGIVQTRAGDATLGYPDRVVGRERGARSAQAYPGRAQCADFRDARTYALPCIAGWPYQLMNYDWDPSTTKPPGEATGTKLMAWGSPYGWLGASAFDQFGVAGQADGTGDRAYATFIVLGPRCRYDGGGTCRLDGDVAETIKAVEALSAATVSTTGTGTLLDSAPRGPGASTTKPLLQGYDDRSASFNLRADGNRAFFFLNAAPGRPIRTPLLVIHGYTLDSLPRVVLNGFDLAVNAGETSGAFVSIDTERGDLWITLNRSVSGSVLVQVTPP